MRASTRRRAITFSEGKPLDPDGKGIYFAIGREPPPCPRPASSTRPGKSFPKPPGRDFANRPNSAMRIACGGGLPFGKVALARFPLDQDCRAIRAGSKTSAKPLSTRGTGLMPRLLFLYLARRILLSTLVVQLALIVPVVLSYLLYTLTPAADSRRPAGSGADRHHADRRLHHPAHGDRRRHGARIRAYVQ